VRGYKPLVSDTLPKMPQIGGIVPCETEPVISVVTNPVELAQSGERSYASGRNCHTTADMMSQALSQDAMETLALTTWIQHAHRKIKTEMGSGTVSDDDLNYLNGVMHICEDAVERDLGPGSASHFKERYDYIRAELASLRESIDQMMVFAQV